ncbi:MAG: glycosyltransferase family 4 protein [Candidatus Woesearchaeota archaeon]
MVKKMKIMIVTDVFPPRCTGAGWSTYHLCRSLRARGHDVVVLMPGKPGKRRYDRFEIHQYGHPIFRELNYKALRKGIEDIAARMRPDAIHAQHMVSCRALAGASVKGSRKLCTVRDYWPSFYDGTMFNFSRKKNYTTRNGYLATMHSIFVKNGLLMKLLSPLAAAYMKWRTSHALSSLRKMDRVLCVSNFVRLMTPVKPEKKAVVVNMVDVEKNDKFRKKEFTGDIVFAGNFNHAKGALEAAEVVGSLPFSVYRRAVFIGDGPLLKRMKRVAGSKATFPGRVDNEEVLEAMAGSLVLLPAHWDEPLSRTILEALSVGACVVASPTGGTGDIIKDGSNGSLCMPKSDVLRAEILRVLKYDKEYYMHKALESAKKFDRNELIHRYEKLYSQ